MELHDKLYGMGPYQYDGTPLGGTIKHNPTDFKVIEVDPHTDAPIPQPPQEMDYHFEEGGLFLVGRIWRENHDHGKMVRELAKAFRVGEEHISTSGIKDARAEIVQLFSVYNPQRVLDDPTMLDLGMEIDSFRYAKERMYPGKMGGNYFEINIRDTNIIDDHEFDYFEAVAKDGLLNYYGYQRFGSGRPITAQLGRAIARKEYEKVVDLYLGGESSQEDEKYRRHWRENKDPEELLMIWDGIQNTEQKILQHLIRRNNDYRGAASKLPDFLINIAKSAFISLLTNQYFSKRGPDKDPQKGERVIDDNIEVAQPSNRWPHPLNPIWQEVFEENEIDMKKDLKSIRHTSRWLFLYPKRWNVRYIEDDVVKVNFQLQNGQYATTVLRELMQSDPSAFF